MEPPNEPQFAGLAFHSLRQQLLHYTQMIGTQACALADTAIIPICVKVQMDGPSGPKTKQFAVILATGAASDDILKLVGEHEELRSSIESAYGNTVFELDAHGNIKPAE